MKVLVVDDERMICEWLQFCIEKTPDCELIGCAHNGEQALVLFEEAEPDVIFTDIKMPVMGGLELLKKVKEISPGTIVVMLTAFAEFDLVREAIRQGGDDYLLKTEMNHQSFGEVLERLKKQTVQKSVKYSGEENQSTGQQHSVLTDILREGRSLTEEDIERLKGCNIKWRDDGLFAAAVWKKELLKDFILPENSHVRHVLGFDYDRSIYVIAGNLTRNLSELEKSQRLYEYALDLSKKNKCMVGISSVTDKLIRLGDAITEAACGLSRGYFAGSERVWQAELGAAQIRLLEEQWQSCWRKKRRELYDVPGHIFYQTIEESLEEAQRQNAVPIREYMAFCCNAMEMAFMRFAREDAQLMHYMLREEKKKVCESTDCRGVRSRVLEFVKNVLATEEVDERKLSRPVAAAVQYVRQHYSEPISLEQVSSQVHLNTEYLSRVFKEEVGCTYSAFVSDVRLKKAAYLLSHTTERVQKIAGQVGYPNVSYFSTIFKKRYGVNPYEYRRREDK